MIVEIPGVLDTDALKHFNRVLDAAPWEDGGVTAGYQSVLAKRNLQLPEQCAEARELGAEVTARLQRNLLFQSAALPAEIFPPLFNRYGEGHSFGAHVDNALRPVPGTGRRLRTDLSATLFLTPPEDYDGGELVIEDTYGAHSVKLEAGSMILYPATSLHEVSPITRGTRTACFFWVQSVIPDDARRAILFDMDLAIQNLRGEVGDAHASMITLTACYHNLVRQWAV
jgi:PKHD-type hydroxylase